MKLRARWVALALLGAIAALCAAAAVDAGRYDVASLARSAPPRTAMMLEREIQARHQGVPFRVDQRWVPYDRISPLLRRAVLVAEDDAFYTHDGLDWTEIKASARRNLEAGRIVRGGSTITQQLAKNLFLGDRRTLLRKFEEMMLAQRLERALPKRRIFELYLNEIEWGDGIYGAEAAAHRYFDVAAADLDARQALLLAAIIINPRRYSPLHPAPRIERRVHIVAGRLHRRGGLDDGQYARAIGAEPLERPGFFERLFGGGGNADTTTRPAEVDSGAAADSI